MKSESQIIGPVDSQGFGSSHFNAVYRQCRLHPTAFKRHHHPKINCRGDNKSASNNFEASFNHENLSRSVPLKQKHPLHQPETKKQWYRCSSHTPTLQADLGLDQGTLHWKTWRNFRDDINPTITEDAEMYKITQDTFRQLTKQVNEVNLQMGRKFTGCGLKSYHSSNPYQSLVIHPSQLAASLPPNRPTIQDHRDNTDPADPPVQIICTSMKQEERKQRLSLRQRLVPPPRPKSTQTSSEGLQGHYDHLSSRMLGKLIDGMAETSVPDCLGPFEIVAKSYHPTITARSESDDDIEDLSIEEKNPYSTADLENIRWNRFKQEKEYMQKKLLGVRLLPEVFTPEDSIFEYRSSNVSGPDLDPLPEALSEPFCYMDLLELSQEEDWRLAVRKVPEEKTEELIMNRLIEMERFQQQTARWERKESQPSDRSPSSLEVKKGWNKVAARPTERAQSSLNKKYKSKNCSDDCLQPACAGDCAVKQTSTSKGCFRCHQSYCKGQCTEYGYHLHIRQSRDAIEKKQRPKSCHSCIRNGKKALNTVNANNVILGRPRSAFSTFSSVQQMKRSKQNKLSYSPNESDEGLVISRLKELQLQAPMLKRNPQKEPVKIVRRRVKSARPLVGRDTLLSGKAYHSQRKCSITKETSSTSAARCNSPTLRAQSAKYRRRLKSAKR